MPAPRPREFRSPPARNTSTSHPGAPPSSSAARRPLIEPPTTSGARRFALRIPLDPAISLPRKIAIYRGQNLEECHGPDDAGQAGGGMRRGEIAVAAGRIAAEFERGEEQSQPLCRQRALVSERRSRAGVWTIRLKPGERIGFPPARARLFLDRRDRAAAGRQHVHDGTTVE